MTLSGSEAGTNSTPQKLEKVVIRFAGDSGDGMQLTGDRFTTEAALFGNDLATQPNYPAEIRAPQGTLPGVSSFQIQIADFDILTAGDRPDVLVAMNPAALKANVGDLPRGGLVIANSDEFTKRNLAKVGYDSNPLETDELSDYVVQAVPMTTLTLGAVEEIGASKKDGSRAKNMFALGLLSWMYSRELQHSERFIREKFARKPEIAEANVLALKAGWNYGETTEAFGTTYEVAPAKLKSGEYRQISGNTALAYGIVVAGQLADTRVMLGSYPITPASDILHELSKHKNFNVLTFQAEDEIAGIGAALGASYGGALGVTSTSGPGVALKAEAIGLGVMAELPLLVVDVQRGGPSTGLPTKTEQADLLQALYGRNGESPVAVLAPQSPSDCFEIAVEAARIALTYRTPVILLSDGAIANGSEPWRIPDVTDSSTFAPIDHTFAKPDEPFQPYARDPETLARQFAVPGTPGLEHRIGGLESANGSGNISYEPKNHDLMVRLRQAKIDGITVPDLVVDDPSGAAELLIVGWGSSYGPIGEACRRARRQGIKVAHAQIRHLNPLPANVGDVLRSYSNVVVPEMNLGQLALLLRGKFLVDIQSVTKVEGMAFLAEEVEGIIESALDGTLREKESDKAKFARLAAATVETGVGAEQ
ncbi:2-oxoglutarate ferredoxin oxidoreductase subunit alpha [Mycobacterium antarcticum]|uniref:2-oxoacid:acceptor oxidoreductase subunit alpha n=1 Tax=unclassified Mycolicibacterium TaxID=2636767 RepID=UPI00238D837D|nr:MULTISPECIES: 2-oxoacid:acceptor oxidoreductase subunit alpha [unclassified Mycolicibacterium]BDX31333.1 2-oxoglutarate ferredoxin oxidoreductase subunit alpha [Mycolicibacterium sp. TUM20985]GLP74685.1 2-oxoglutarate ferredoxin oxidoreductase subunit alpha [Mycolicibacterium sp. TUM20983]